MGTQIDIADDILIDMRMIAELGLDSLKLIFLWEFDAVWGVRHMGSKCLMMLLREGGEDVIEIFF